MKMLDEIKERVRPFGKLSYLVYCGSLTYGTSRPDSDVDVQGFFIPNFDYLVGIKSVDQVQIEKFQHGKKEVEGVIYDIRKVFRLLSNCNPNVLEMLFVKPNFVLFSDKNGNKVVNNKDLFLSKRIKHTFGGYAYSQMLRLASLNENANTNRSRVDRVEKFGYDTKNALHLFRLLSMGYEALTEGTLNVFRLDRDFLKEIFDGRYKHEEMVEMAEKKFQLLEQAYVASTLPSKVNQNAIDSLLREILVDCAGEMLFIMEG